GGPRGAALPGRGTALAGAGGAARRRLDRRPGGADGRPAGRPAAGHGRALGRGAGRLPELDAVDVPTLVVQGVSDPFGMPPPGPHREVVRQPGTHALAGDLPGLR